MNFSMKIMALLFAISVLPFSAAAQEQEETLLLTGSISGRVINSSTREPLPAANVVVIGTSFGAATDLDGVFTISQLPVGVYSVRASVIGYQAEVISDVVVSTSRPAQLTFALIQMDLELDEVTVTAGYFRTSPATPVSTIVQGNEEIRRSPGSFEDVVRAISILPGVAQAEGGRNDLIVRGGAPSENLYIVDNIEVPNINHFGTQGAAGGPTSYINLDFVDNVSFSTGGFGARYGDRLSSVMTINLRNGRMDRVGGKATISATQFGINLEGPVNENGSFLFSARRSYLDFIFKAAGFGFVPEYWDFLGRTEYRLSDHDRLTVLGILALDNVRLFNETAEQRYNNSRILSSDQTQFTGGASWQHLFGSGFVTTTLGQSIVRYNFGQQDWNTDYENDEIVIDDIFRNNSLEHETSLRSDITMQLTRRTEFSFGVQGKAIRFIADVELDTIVDAYGETLYTDAYFDTVSYKASAYAQISHRFSYLRWTVGGRFDYFNMIENPVAFSPRVSVSYPLTPHTNLNASFGQYYQSPSNIWLVAYPENRNLDYIGVNQVIAGFDHLFRDDSRMSLELFYKDYFDYPTSLLRPYLVMANTGAGYGGVDEGFASFGLDPLSSGGEGWARGFEISLQKRLSDSRWYGLFSLSYTESMFTALDGEERPGAYDQRWIMNFGGGFIPNENWEFAAKFRFATGKPYTPYNPDGTKSVINYFGERVDANHSLDLRADRRWYFPNWVLIGYIDVQNVYAFESNSPPQWDYRNMRVDEESSITILPSIGISVEF